ncbi:hypothetical protein [Comamonas granuli]|uniref:hypothetical protein n=1 Tax=Comamonas granuli TaxID=290309 RepID=UPI0005A84B58|nr:hypothetical protein [Comamonas granuli]
MTMPPPGGAARTPPRFVPTLTEVVAEGSGAPPAPPGPAPAPAAAPRPVAPPQQPAAVSGVSRGTSVLPPPAAAVRALQPGGVAVRPVPEGFEEMMVHRVMQRVDVLLEKRLREAIAQVVQEQTRSILPRLREEVESVVRQSVYEAVADELASHTGAP